eukprot:scaffold73317_cov32-Tisochrysis_lutea.AAC.2
MGGFSDVVNDNAQLGRIVAWRGQSEGCFAWNPGSPRKQLPASSSNSMVNGSRSMRSALRQRSAYAYALLCLMAAIFDRHTVTHLNDSSMDRCVRARTHALLSTGLTVGDVVRSVQCSIICFGVVVVVVVAL